MKEKSLSLIEQLFEQGVISGGEKIKADSIRLEADATYVAKAYTDGTPLKSHAKVRVNTGVVYIEKIVDGKRCLRMHPIFFAQTGSAQQFKMEVATTILNTFDTTCLKKIYIGSDGEACYKNWDGFFPASIELESYLDAFHISQSITKAFNETFAKGKGRDRKEVIAARHQVYDCVNRGDLIDAIEVMQGYIELGIVDFHSAKKLAEYLFNNKDAIKADAIGATPVL